MNIEEKIAQFKAIDLTESNWYHIELGEGLDGELIEELSPKHVLYNKPFVMIARGVGSDDVLIMLGDEENYIAGVHLTWNLHPEPDPRWPDTWFYRNIQDFIDREVG